MELGWRNFKHEGMAEFEMEQGRNTVSEVLIIQEIGVGNK
jgi:hypothetical protein